MPINNLEHFKILTDITSSETSLKRFSEITKEIFQHNFVTEPQIIKICINKNITNEKVIRRHLHILKVLGIIIKRDNNYFVTSSGKVISNLSKQNNILSKEEKAYYFQLFFKSIFPQLFNILTTIKHNENYNVVYKKSFEKNLIDYFSIDIIQKIWIKKTIINSIDYYKETGKLRRGVENKFETMLKWLKNIDLIQIYNNIQLTNIGNNILNYLLQNDIDEDNIEYASLFILTNNPQKINIIKDYYLLKNYYINAINIFTNYNGYGDLKAINDYVFIKICSDKLLYLDKNNMKKILSILQEENLIKSFILDRKGQLAFIQTK